VAASGGIIEPPYFHEDELMLLSAADALARLQQGNQNFADHIRTHGTLAGLDAAAELIQTQRPFATIVGCSDSRAPLEIVFNQGVGDLFVIRIAGNTMDPPQIGSIEFAAEKLGTRLVVIMGHTQCGAVGATIEALQHPEAEQSPNLLSIVERIRPTVAPLMETDLRHDPAALSAAAIRANVAQSVQQLRANSPLMRQHMDSEESPAAPGLGPVKVVGAEYAVETGVVEFFDTPD
jgi:carbonic anhydrase